MILLGSSLLFCYIFYWKSIKSFKVQSGYDQKLVQAYIRSLKSYAFAQLTTYVSATLFVMMITGAFSFMDIMGLLYLQMVIEGLAGLAGFSNCLIFILNGSSHETITGKDWINYDLSLTLT